MGRALAGPVVISVHLSMPPGAVSAGRALSSIEDAMACLEHDCALRPQKAA